MLSDNSAFQQIANDGNLLPGPVTLTQTDQLGIAERYDIVIDFSRYSLGAKVQLVNILATRKWSNTGRTCNVGAGSFR